MEYLLQRTSNYHYNMESNNSSFNPDQALVEYLMFGKCQVSIKPIRAEIEWGDGGEIRWVPAPYSPVHGDKSSGSSEGDGASCPVFSSDVEWGGEGEARYNPASSSPVNGDVSLSSGEGGSCPPVSDVELSPNVSRRRKRSPVSSSDEKFGCCTSDSSGSSSSRNVYHKTRQDNVSSD